MSTNKNRDMRDNMSNIFGSKIVSQITPFEISLENLLGQGSVEGFMSRPEWGLGRSSSDRQYFYVNGRPCILPKVKKKNIRSMVCRAITFFCERWPKP